MSYPRVEAFVKDKRASRLMLWWSAVLTVVSLPLGIALTARHSSLGLILVGLGGLAAFVWIVQAMGLPRRIRRGEQFVPSNHPTNLEALVITIGVSFLALYLFGRVVDARSGGDWSQAAGTSFVFGMMLGWEWAVVLSLLIRVEGEDS